jgi:hypothetical protein
MLIEIQHLPYGQKNSILLVLMLILLNISSKENLVGSVYVFQCQVHILKLKGIYEK